MCVVLITVTLVKGNFDHMVEVLAIMIPSIGGCVGGIFTLDILDRKSLFRQGYKIDNQGNIRKLRNFEKNCRGRDDHPDKDFNP